MDILVSVRFRNRTPESRAAFLRGQTSGDEDILTIEGVAKLLHCTIDAVRRIPEAHLPAHKGPGKHHLYLRCEVISYVLGCSREGRFITAHKSALTDERVPPRIGSQAPSFTDLKRQARACR